MNSPLWRADFDRAKKWMTPGIGVKRWVFLFAACSVLGALGLLYFLWSGPYQSVVTQAVLAFSRTLGPGVALPWTLGAGLLLLSFPLGIHALLQMNRAVLRGAGVVPEQAVNEIYSRHTLSKGPRIVAIGGGTGLSNLLSGLKVYSSNLTAIVTVADDGGSSGRLRASLDMIAPGDLTDCYAALSKHPALSQLLLHRFDRGEGLEGHTFGNLLLATLSEDQGGLANAMQDLHEILRVQGKVYPATTVPATLRFRLSDGRDVVGESRLAHDLGTAQVREVGLLPADPPALPEVLSAIAEAELIVLGPGSLFTSILPVLLVPEIAAAIRSSPARLVYVASLMTEPGETTGLTLEDHFNAVSAHLGRSPDHLLVNQSIIPHYIRQHYAAEGSFPLEVEKSSRNLRGRLIYAPLLKQEPTTSARHDSAELARWIIALVLDGPQARR